jgi:betaine-aldehyde dehydrogenase
LSVINPATEEEIVKISSASAEDVDIAVDAARQAFERQG